MSSALFLFRRQLVRFFRGAPLGTAGQVFFLSAPANVAKCANDSANQKTFSDESI